MPAQGRLSAGRLARERARLLRTRGLLVLRVPAPPLTWTECFSWILAPPENEDAHLFTWYLDGSMLDGDWVDLRAVGFAIVVVSHCGDLVGYGLRLFECVRSHRICVQTACLCFEQLKGVLLRQLMRVDPLREYGHTSESLLTAKLIVW